MDGVEVLYRVAGHQLLIELGFPDAAFLKFDILCTFFSSLEFGFRHIESCKWRKLDFHFPHISTCPGFKHSFSFIKAEINLTTGTSVGQKRSSAPKVWSGCPETRMLDNFHRGLSPPAEWRAPTWGWWGWARRSRSGSAGICSCPASSEPSCAGEHQTTSLFHTCEAHPLFYIVGKSSL